MLERSAYRLGAVLVVVFACLVSPAQDEPPAALLEEVALNYEYVWGIDETVGSLVPLRVEIENPLDNDSGVVTIRSGSYRMLYPVELPAKTTRSFVAYFPSQGGMETTITLECRQARIKFPITPRTEYGYTLNFGLISDATSLLRFIRAMDYAPPGTSERDSFSQISLRDYAARPGFAPERSVGYEGLDLLVLGEGAERMTDGEVWAAQRYVLSGGTLVVTGGAVAPILRDERWAAYLPGSQPRVINVQGSRLLADLTGVPLGDTLTLTQITPAPGTTGLAEGGIPMLWYRRCGLGTVAYWAFDPFVSPMRTYAGRAKLFIDTAVATGDEPESYKQELGVVSASRDEMDPYYYYPGYEEQSQNSVFRVSMPSTGKLFLILGGYFLVVVPINFIVLSKLGRGQLAWVTSPAVGLAFAAVFFYVARDLYSTNLSRATNSLVVAHEGAQTAYVVGKQQLFFPNGGRYDLGFEGVEAVTTETDYYEYYGPRTDTGFAGDLVDVGEVIAPRAGVSNLAFREFLFGQSLPWQHQLPLQVRVEIDREVIRAEGALTNDTPYTLRDVKLLIEGREVPLGQVNSGATREFKESVGSLPVLTRSTGKPPMGKGLVALTAHVPDLVTGTGLGEEKGQGVTLYYTYGSVSVEGL